MSGEKRAAALAQIDQHAAAVNESIDNQLADVRGLLASGADEGAASMLMAQMLMVTLMAAGHGAAQVIEMYCFALVRLAKAEPPPDRTEP